MVLGMVVIGVRVDVQRGCLAGHRGHEQYEQDRYHAMHDPSVCNRRHMGQRPVACCFRRPYGVTPRGLYTASTVVTNNTTRPPPE